MRLHLFAAAAILGACTGNPSKVSVPDPGTATLEVLAQADMHVRFSNSNGAAFANAEGTVATSSTGISVNLRSLTLTASSRNQFSVMVQSVRFGLAIDKTGGEWEVTNWSEPVKVEADVQPGKELILRDVSAAITVGNEVSLQQRWLVLECRFTTDELPNYKGIALTTYAHSSKTLFAALP